MRVSSPPVDRATKIPEISKEPKSTGVMAGKLVSSSQLQQLLGIGKRDVYDVEYMFAGREELGRGYEKTSDTDTIVITSNRAVKPTERCQLCQDVTTDLRIQCGDSNCTGAICVRGGPPNEASASGCISFKDKERFLKSAGNIDFRCLRCCLKLKIPFPLELSTYKAFPPRIVMVNLPVLVTGLVYQDIDRPCVFDLALKALQAVYMKNDPRNLHWTDALVMGERGIDLDATRQSEGFTEANAFLDEVADAGWLCIVESHAMTQKGGIVTAEQDSADGQTVLNFGQKVSEALQFWLGKDMMNRVKGKASIRHLRMIALCVCGPVIGVTKSLNDLKGLVERDVIDCIVGFSREFVTPQLVYQQLAAMCTNAFMWQNLSDKKPWERLRTAIELAFGGQSHILEHSPVVLISKRNGVVDCTAFVYGSPNSMPWGLEPPPCDQCGTNAHVHCHSEEGSQTFTDDVGKTVSARFTANAKYECTKCDRRTNP
ncbi:hypothetical protein BD410DRAFT_810498, partial [Rickenella mellea]